MKRILFLAVFALSGTAASAQETKSTERKVEGPEHFWHYSPSLSDQQLYDYNRLMFMSKEDWELFRSDARYDHDRVNEVYHANRQEVPIEQFGKRMMPDDDCQCWVEPDLTYILSYPESTNGWACDGGAQDGVDCWKQINLPFDFCFYGTTYNTVYLTSKGTISFGTGYYDWTPSEFPIPDDNAEPQYDHVCGFWADFDFRSTGSYRYKITDDELYVNFIDVGYFNQHSNLRNTFQMIITSNNSSVLSDGNNVQFCYVDMDFAHGDVGGSGGCCGPYPATVGTDKESGNQHIQYGRFNLTSSAEYNGPYGIGGNEVDGVDWLDNKVFEFNACDEGANTPPLSTAAAPCDTLFVCQGGCIDLGMQFLAPEIGQTVTITFSETGTGGGLTASTTTEDGLQTLIATFCAESDNVGIHTVTITGTDNGTPQGITTLTYIISVLDIIPPPLTIEGDLSVCAGGLTELCASDGFDSYAWNGTGESCITQCCMFQGGGAVTVTGYIAQCSVQTASAIVQGPFEYICWEPGPGYTMCQSDSVEICICDPDQYDLSSITWSNWENFCADIPYAETGDSCIWVYGGCESHISLFAYDTLGCQQFNIPVIYITGSTIGEENEVYEDWTECTGNFTPAEFCCSYTSPANGFLNLYLISGNTNGWNGSYINVTVTPCDGDPPTTYTFSSSTNFELQSVQIEYCDEICITYGEGGLGDENNTLYIYNCINQDPLILGPGLENGTLWCGTSGCLASELPGTWTVTGPGGWTMTDMTVYNPLDGINYFSPSAYGIYTLTFTDPDCIANQHTYTLEYNLPPTIDLVPGSNMLLCSGESAEVCTNIFNPGGAETLQTFDWDGSGVDPDPDNVCATIGPYTSCSIVTVNVEIENGCGSDEDELVVTAQLNVPEPSLGDDFICNDATLTLDPIPANQEISCMQYEWSNGATTPTIDVTETGEYCVSVFNLCSESEEVCAEIVIVAAADSDQLVDVTSCDTGEYELCLDDVPAGYTVIWNTNETSDCITVTQTGTYTATITDDQNCNTQAVSSATVTIEFTPTAVGGDPTPQVLCPGQCVSMDMEGGGNSTSYSWDVSCNGLNLPNSEVTDFCSDQVPLECLGFQVSVVGTVSNVCGSDQTEPWVFLPDICAVTIPNIFTPNGDGYNPFFYIVGLENYLSGKFFVYDRWGGLVYESDEKYANNWPSEEITDGTYYYILQLPYGKQTEFEGSFTVVKE